VSLVSGISRFSKASAMRARWAAGAAGLGAGTGAGVAVADVGAGWGAGWGAGRGAGFEIGADASAGAPAGLGRSRGRIGSLRRGDSWVRLRNGGMLRRNSSSLCMSDLSLSCADPHCENSERQETMKFTNLNKFWLMQGKRRPQLPGLSLAAPCAARYGRFAAGAFGCRTGPERPWRAGLWAAGL